jgi:predicted ATP-grasp superfamily ATP-dependent carboligase
MKAFVTDGDQRPALAIARSLGRRGVSVLVGEERPVSLASSSRYCREHVTYPSPYTEPDAFERFLLEFVERERIDVVIPVTDVTTDATARNQHALERHTSAAVPPFEAFDLVTNKWTLIQRAARCAIPTPATHLAEGMAGLPAFIDRIEFPVVVKPVRSRLRTEAGWLAAPVHYAHSKSDLRRLYEQTESLGSYPSLIQQRIDGPGLGVFVLCEHGRLLAAFAHRRLREKPPSGGVSVLCESAAVDPELREQAMRLLAPLGWHGVAMLEYKQDRRTGRPFLIEVNGRFWGSLQLAIDAGVDFPYLSYQLALGQSVRGRHPYKAGVRSRWLLGDLDHLWLRLFHAGHDLPESTPSRLHTLIEFLKLAAPDLHYDVISRDDPHPMVYELQGYARSAVESATDRVRRPMARLRGSPRLRSTALSGTLRTTGKDAGALR